MAPCENARAKIQTTRERDKEGERERDSTNGINGVNISPRVEVEGIRGRVGLARIDGHELCYTKSVWTIIVTRVLS